MWPLFFFGLLVAASVAFYFVYLGQNKKIAALKRAHDKLETEESRVFEFLHGLSEAFAAEVRIGDLHRLIVESAVRILDAHGGALYLVDRKRQILLPSFVSKSCPPLLEFPPHILQQGESTPVALESYFRLHAVEAGEGLIGTVWRDQEATLLSSDDGRLNVLRDTTLQTGSALLSPLMYAGENLGVIAVANGPMSTSFSESDFAIFKAISEQSAFALYNAIVYSEASEKRRLDMDLQTAQEIQRILLPDQAPAMDGYEVSGMNIPARHVSGDYYDYIEVDETRVGVAIADVSGKGVPASLIMAMCRSVLRGEACGNASAAEVLHKVNRQLYPDIKEDMFISMAYVVLDNKSSSATLCRAGHDAPLFYSAKEGTVVRVNPPGMALGIDSGGVFDRVTADFSITMDPGDCLVLYTDGVTEALGEKGAEFGLKRVIQSIQASAAEGAPGILRRVTEDLREFVRDEPQNDDITLIAIRKK